MIGRRLYRIEDDRLLRGYGCYLDDLHVEGTVEVAFFRSPHAHARITSLDVSAARDLKGVVAIFDGAYVVSKVDPMVFDIATIIPETVAQSTGIHVRVHPMPPLALERVTYVGQPILMVVAVDRYVAEDALELIEADFEPLPAVMDAEAALQPEAPLVEPTWEDNVAVSFHFAKGDVEAALACADIVVEERFRLSRCAASPIETRGVVASVDPQDGSLTVWSSTQTPHQVRDFLARALRRDPGSIRVRAPDVGGSFGVKHSCYPEDLLVPLAALELGRPVKWVEDRAEHLSSATHGRDQTHYMTVGATRDGRLLAVRDRAVMNLGAFNILGLVVPYNSFTHLVGPYKVDAVEVDFRAAITNTAMVAPFRGAGRPEAVFAMERAIDRVARELGLDPFDVRLRNAIQPKDMPYTTGIVYRDGVPQVYDSGDYPELLRHARDLIGKQDLLSSENNECKRVGIGYALFTEGTGLGPFETARIRVEASGRILAYTGASSQGQGHQTTLAQIVAEALSVPVENVTVMGGDSAGVTEGFGTLASRTAVVAGNALFGACQTLLNRVFEAASFMLKIPADQLVLDNGMIRSRNNSIKEAVSLSDVASFLSPWNPDRPDDMPGELEAYFVYQPSTVTWAAGAHAAAVAVDLSTGRVELLRYAAVHDAGRVINPEIAEGQVLGGVMQGVGGALFEEIIYDDAGQLLTGSFMDYMLPTVAEAREVRVLHKDVPSPSNPLGVKGLGEGGAIGPPAAVANAVEAALADLGVVVRDCPLSSTRVFELVRHAVEPEVGDLPTSILHRASGMI